VIRQGQQGARTMDLNNTLTACLTIWSQTLWMVHWLSSHCPTECLIFPGTHKIDMHRTHIHTQTLACTHTNAQVQRQAHAHTHSHIKLYLCHGLQQGSSIRFVQGPDCVPADTVGAGPRYIALYIYYYMLLHGNYFITWVSPGYCQVIRLLPGYYRRNYVITWLFMGYYWLMRL